MAADPQSLTFRELVTRLNHFADQWEELLRNHEAMLRELHGTKDELQRVVREFATMRAEYEQALNQRDEILGVLNSLLTRYRRDRPDREADNPRRA